MIGCSIALKTVWKQYMPWCLNNNHIPFSISLGWSKINNNCTASITVTTKSNGQVNIEICYTHYRDEHVLQHIRPPSRRLHPENVFLTRYEKVLKTAPILLICYNWKSLWILHTVFFLTTEENGSTTTNNAPSNKLRRNNQGLFRQRESMTECEAWDL